MAFCSNCGSPLVEGAAFCSGCGAKILAEKDCKPTPDPVPTPDPKPEGPKAGTVILIVVASLAGVAAIALVVIKFVLPKFKK
jgi:uncharacterized membrane protein YvbJ